MKRTLFPPHNGMHPTQPSSAHSVGKAARRIGITLITLIVLGLHGVAQAQDVALKTNLLYDATATANLGIEIGLSPRWSLDLSGNLNAWDFSHNRKWKHWLAQPEIRRWFCSRFSGHFLALHAHVGQYNVGNLDNSIDFLGTDLSMLSDNRYEGWFVGAGIAYGYDWILGKHWNLEAEIGIGYAYTWFDRYDTPKCFTLIESDLDHHYIGLTKLALSIVYVF